jgi:hypothetical protein
VGAPRFTLCNRYPRKTGEQQLKLFRVFVASPGDLGDERRALRDVVEKINAIYSKETEWRLELLGWEDTLPGTGRPQELINTDLDKAELFVGCLWQRWGSSSGEDGKTGFEEEFERALERHARTGSSCSTTWTGVASTSRPVLGILAPASRAAPSAACPSPAERWTGSLSDAEQIVQGWPRGRSGRAQPKPQANDSCGWAELTGLPLHVGTSTASAGIRVPPPPSGHAPTVSHLRGGPACRQAIGRAQRDLAPVASGLAVHEPFVGERVTIGVTRSSGAQFNHAAGACVQR